MGFNSRCDKFCEDLNQIVPIDNLGKLWWHVGCRCLEDCYAGTCTTSQQVFAESTVATFRVTRGNSVPVEFEQKLKVFDHNEPDVDEPFPSVVGHLMCLANHIHPGILNAVLAVVSYSAAPKLLHWQAALHNVIYIKR